MATLPIYLEVEDVALGPVLIKLRSMPGIIKLHLDLLEGGNAAAPRQPGVPKPNIQQTVLAYMMKIDTPQSSAEIANGAGIAKSSIYGALNQLKEKGMVKPGMGGTWELSAKTRREMDHVLHGEADDSVKLLPKPRAEAKHPKAKGNGKGHPKNGARAAPGLGWRLLRSALDGGPMKRSDLVTHLGGHGMSDKSVTGVLERAKRAKLALNDDKGTWQLTSKGKQHPAEAAGETA